ncbi:hypothetical protein SDC9_154389 [bioreactor metagenome]|uniref:Uncharacterized protein n=1 Tax=bioreactor metagenome TaxID=1076179 RepID=A0A645F393_9ZZZZ
MIGVIFNGEVRSGVRPVFKELALNQQFIQPGGVVIAQAAEELQVLAAGYNVNGIDLQKAQTADAGKHIFFASGLIGWGEQPLGMQHPLAAFLQADLRNGHVDNYNRNYVLLIRFRSNE